MTKVYRGVLGVVLALIVGLGLPSGQLQRSLAQETGTQQPPNIVFILTDDQDAESISVMPKLRSLLVEQGTTFNNALVTDPLCCPARATFLRGQYSHNTRIQGNSAPEGGHNKFRSLGPDGDRSTVATWLDDAGYDTFYAGKYMNGYGGKTCPRGGTAGTGGWATTTAPAASTA
jgi:arylsulfatase A-like enzyme